jgi:t-SNARE complex subunit (syntaxin)
MLQNAIPKSKGGYEKVTNEDLIKDRRNEIEKIEEDTNEIFDLVQSIDYAVNEQDADILLIEENINNSHKNIQDSASELRRANKRKKRKRFWKISGILVGLFLIIGGIIILAL